MSNMKEKLFYALYEDDYIMFEPPEFNEKFNALYGVCENLLKKKEAQEINIDVNDIHDYICALINVAQQTAFNIGFQVAVGLLTEK